jgi:hypothetical protein
MKFRMIELPPSSSIKEGVENHNFLKALFNKEPK